MKYFLCLFICCQFFVADTTAQITRDTLAYTIDNYTDEEGLPQNTVNYIMEDEFGFIWFATEGGMVRFNGASFKVFDKSILPCSRSNRISSILKIPELGMFAITENDRSIKISNGIATCDSTATKQVNQKIQEWRKYSEMISFGLPDYLQENFIIPLGMDKYIQYRNDYVIFREKGLSDSIPFYKGYNARFFIIENELYCFNDSGSLTNIRKKTLHECDLTGDILSDKTFDRRKSKISIFWNNAMHNTLIFYNRSFYDIERLPDGTLVTHLIFANIDLQSEQFTNPYYDRRNKRLFLGTVINGLYVITQKNFKIHIEDPKRINNYYAIAVYDSNSVVTPMGMEFRPDGMFPLVKHAQDYRVDMGSIQLDHLDNIWIKGGDILYRYDRKFHLLEKMKFPNELAALYCSADDSTLWIGQRGPGLNKINISATSHTGKANLVFRQTPPVVFMASVTKQKLLIGTNNGLYILNVISNKLVYIDQLKNKNIRSIFVKELGEIWITTYGDGIFLLRNRKMSHMPYDRNKSLVAAHCMMLDKKDFFWISTNKGLIKASRKDLIAYADHQQKEVFYQHFEKEDGLYTNEFNGGCQPCGAQLHNGAVVLPSLNGLVWMDPLKMNEELPNRQLLLDRIEVDNENIVLQDTITLSGKFDNISFHLSTAYFGNRKNVQMSFMLIQDKKRDQWYPVNDNGVISFSSLPSGSYELRVRKINGFGRNNYTTLSVRFIVPEAFYETVWFKILIVLGVILIIYLYARVRTYYILKRNRLLDLLIARRTRTLTNTLHALRISEASLRRQTQIQEMLIAAISHDIRSPMKYLTMVSKMMQQLLEKKDYDSLTAFNEGIQDTASKVYTILDNLINYISIQLKAGDIRNETVDIFKLVNDKIDLFSAIAHTNNTQIRSGITPGMTVIGDEALLGVIIHNLIDNAVKFTANGSIEIYKEDGSAENTFVLVIKDSGTGIPKELVGWLNANTEKVLKMETISGHKGMGLMIIKELLASANAKLQVASDEHGTTIRMFFKKNETTEL